MLGWLLELLYPIRSMFCWFARVLAVVLRSILLLVRGEPYRVLRLLATPTSVALHNKRLLLGSILWLVVPTRLPLMNLVGERPRLLE